MDRVDVVQLNVNGHDGRSSALEAGDGLCCVNHRIACCSTIRQRFDQNPDYIE